VFTVAAKTHLKKLDVIQRKAARIVYEHNIHSHKIKVVIGSRRCCSEGGEGSLTVIYTTNFGPKSIRGEAQLSMTSGIKCLLASLVAGA